MPKARIIRVDPDNSRLWKAAGVFAVAAAGAVWYALSGPEEVSAEVPTPVAQKAEPRLPQVWGHVAEQDASGQQKPTNDMWGLLQLAENQRAQAQDEADRKYSASLGPDECKKFWAARMYYDSFINEADAHERWNLLYKIDHGHKELAYFFPAAGDKEDPKTGHQIARAEAARQAAPQLLMEIKNNPDDHIGNYGRSDDLSSMSHIAGMAYLRENEYGPIRENNNPAALMQAYAIVQDYMQKPETYEFKGVYGDERFKRSIIFLYDTINPPTSAGGQFIKEQGLTDQQLQEFINGAWIKLDQLQKFRDERRDQRAAQFRKDHRAPC